jgi:hypothetical protein
MNILIDSEFTKVDIFFTSGHQFMTPKTHNQQHNFLLNANLNGLWIYFLMKEAGITPMTFHKTEALYRFYITKTTGDGQMAWLCFT